MKKILFIFNGIVDLINENLGKKVKPEYVSKPNAYLEETLADNSLLKKYFTTTVSVKVGIKKIIDSLIRDSYLELRLNKEKI